MRRAERSQGDDVIELDLRLRPDLALTVGTIGAASAAGGRTLVLFHLEPGDTISDMLLKLGLPADAAVSRRPWYL